MSFKGVAIVTGSARGIGRGIALRLAYDGYDVAVNDLESNKELVDEVIAEIKRKGRRSVGIFGDVSLEVDVKRMIEEVVEVFGGLDVMVANAGIGMKKLLANTTVEEWDRHFAVNVRGTFLCIKHAAAQMISDGRKGRIVAACSVSSKRAWPEVGLYTSTKYAIRAVVQTAAQEYGEHGITVNAYAPGIIDTDMLDQFDEYHVKKDGTKPGEWKQSWNSVSALRRNGKPADVAKLVSYLVSQEADYITGQTITVDGGIVFD